MGLDPNSDDREKIIREYIISHQSYLSYRHKFALLNKFGSALKDKDFDFSIFFGVDVDSHTATAWDASEVETPHSFFEDIYRVASEVWMLELSKAGEEDMSAW